MSKNMLPKEEFKTICAGLQHYPQRPEESQNKYFQWVKGQIKTTRSRTTLQYIVKALSNACNEIDSAYELYQKYSREKTRSKKEKKEEPEQQKMNIVDCSDAKQKEMPPAELEAFEADDSWSDTNPPEVITKEQITKNEPTECIAQQIANVAIHAINAMLAMWKGAS